jgi:hypothetical protein
MIGSARRHTIIADPARLPPSFAEASMALRAICCAIHLTNAVGKILSGSPRTSAELRNGRKSVRNIRIGNPSLREADDGTLRPLAERALA